VGVVHGVGFPLPGVPEEALKGIPVWPEFGWDTFTDIGTAPTGFCCCCMGVLEPVFITPVPTGACT
jgi:hypothetical protein